MSDETLRRDLTHLVLFSDLVPDDATRGQIRQFVAGVTAAVDAHVKERLGLRSDLTAQLLAARLEEWNNPADPYFVIAGSPNRSAQEEASGDPYLPIARAALAALEGQP